jgi:ubiquinone/menaquinone biosynthesis C-methylase UbiE
MLGQLFSSVAARSPGFRRNGWQRVYQFLATTYANSTAWTFMNYGYEPLDPADRPLLMAGDEANRYFIQLYHYVATAVELTGLDLLEVGSGRGGGAAYIKRYLKPKSMTGLDFSPRASRFCQGCHQIDGLTFITGDAEALPFADASFDAVINIESSHCYGSMGQFVAQVVRVLRPDGYFLFADFRDSQASAQLERQLTQAGLEVVRKVDITPNVLAALDTYNEEKLALIEQQIHWWMRKLFANFAAVKGSPIYESFRDGQMVYHHYLLRKRAAAD